MGPFVPDPITPQLNLVVALLLGLAFGFVLEQAGFSSSRRLAGVFYGYDFTVLRVFFTAAITAMSGALLLSHLGLLDLDRVFVNPLWTGPALVGGVIMGLGFILGGYCPGTSICAAAIGKIDALFFILGGLLGVLAFGELFPLYQTFHLSGALGPVQVFRSLGLSRGVFAFLLIAMAIIAFVVTTKIERRVALGHAPSRAFRGPWHVLAGLAALGVGVMLIFLSDYKTRLVHTVQTPAYQARHATRDMTADELAFRILDQDPLIKVLDLRTSEAFTRLPLPGATNLALDDFFGREGAQFLSPRHIQKVVVAEDEATARTACLLAQELGFENMSLLKGGFPDFDRTILHPGTFVPEGTRWDADVKAFREEARIQMEKWIAENRNPKPKAPKKTKAVQGGC